jgi:DNA-binding MarR family transcriptional regulator
MAIIEDSIKILAYIYKEKKTNQLKIIEASDFDKERVKQSMEFLEQKGLITYSYKDLSGIRKDIKCTSEGIELIESPTKSKERKNIAINLNVNMGSIFKVDFDSLIKLDSVFKGSLF